MRLLAPLALSLFPLALAAPPVDSAEHGGGAEPRVAEAQASVTIVVTATGLRSDDGYARFALFDGPRGFPGGKGDTVSARQVRIQGGRATVRFSGLPAGSYAVALHHDENGNGKMDTRAMGIPTEGYGVSRNPEYGWGPPKWKDAEFDVRPGVELGLKIKAFYPRWAS